jgi:uncharacterized protein YbjT (DUF2867 family)
MSEKRAFIAGATGYTGKALVRDLLGRNVETYAHIRPGSSSLPEAKHMFTDLGAMVDLTPWEPASMEETLAQIQPTHVFFVIGTTKKRMREDEGDNSYEAIDFGLAKLLVDAAKVCESKPVFVYLSAQGTSEGASTAYYRARWKAEEAVRESGLPYVIARPGFISGGDREESRPMERFGSAVATAAASALGVVGAEKLEDKLRPRDADEMARQLANAALDTACHGETLESQELWEL